MSDPASTRRLLISQPRSGTHWLKFMISRVLGQDPLDARLEDPEVLERALETEGPRRLVYDHLDFTPYHGLVDPARWPGLRIVVLYRNPVDARILSFSRWKHIKGLDLPAPELSPQQNFLLYLRGHWTERPPPDELQASLVRIPFRDWV